MWKHCLSLGTLFALAMPATSMRRVAETTNADLHLALETKGGQTVFRIGELITLQLTYSLTPGSRNSYVITNASYDRSGRLGIETFHIEPAGGWDDPLRLYFASFSGFIGGGLSSSAKLTTSPAVISRNLNEWVRFDAPGHYRLGVTSSRVQRVGETIWTNSLTVRSNEISLTIVPATSEWQKAALETAIAKLGKSESVKQKPGFDHTSDERNDAIATLRYLGTPAAAAEMAGRLNDESSASQFMLGLASTPARGAALEKMEQLLNDPEYPVTDTFLSTLSLVALSPETTSDRVEQREKLQDRFEEELLKALPNKRGKARAISAYSIVNARGMRSRELPLGEKRELTAQLVAGFDSLPSSAQLALLEYRWSTLDKDAIRPLLPKIAERYRDFPELRQTDAYQANELSAAALHHWWEIDPAEARPAIIREILRPRPRFGAEVLGILPEKTLPDVEQELADHLTNGSGNESQIASLLCRYATASVEEQVAAYLHQNVGKLACAIQAPLLAYVLRVDSLAAVPLLQRALAARGPGFSACNHSLFVDVANLQSDPLLQDLAIPTLDDADPEVAANAAAYLAEYGTPAAEAPLWVRLVSWSSEWKGREVQLRYVPGESMDGVYQAGLGTNLILALGAGQSWLTDRMKLTQLLDLSVTPEQRMQVQQILESWEHQPRQIEFIAFGKGEFQIAQCHAKSAAAAISKLKQFPQGTRFTWAGELKQEGEEQAYQQIVKAVSPSGITIALSEQR